ncbi:MAG: FAD-binding oxidoreductase [Corynebacterium sp.]|nr:FAD-binding oxidoreductase [Corynebacterium sp.]
MTDKDDETQDWLAQWEAKWANSAPEPTAPTPEEGEATLVNVATRLKETTPEFHARIRRTFSDQFPETMLIFPRNKENVHQFLVPVLTYVLERTPISGIIPPELETMIRQLGLDHRKYNITPRYFPPFAVLLRDALIAACADLSTREVAAADRVIERVATLLEETAAEADAHQVPRNYKARVESVERRSRRISVVRLRALKPIPFTPGQYFPITSDIIPGQWRFLTSALPPNETGEMEFHIRIWDNGAVSGALGNSRIGDTWTLGNPYGRLHIEPDRDVVMVANSVGLAPMRALLLSLLSTPNPPHVHLYFGAEYPGELYDLGTLWEIWRHAPWLRVTTVTAHDADEWWVRGSGGAGFPDGLFGDPVIGTLNDVVPTFGPFTDQQVLIAGPPAWIPSMRDALIAAGTPTEIILYNAL